MEERVQRLPLLEHLSPERAVVVVLVIAQWVLVALEVEVRQRILLAVLVL
jgi:hypothetical protein